MNNAYPIYIKGKRHFLKYPLPLTGEIRDHYAQRFRADLIGMEEWIAVEVLSDGFQYSQHLFTFCTEDDCRKYCDEYNESLGFTKLETLKIIAKSMGLLK